ncbi:MAG: SDR family NAD(P)-dependent oxidoreductase [Anaerolineaceae bacterium]|nr:SDR family NAD(P)-dependent oxidoreductase [Anaerolineaceae bacterium]
MKSYALITGATGGLGKALAAECASRGWNLFLTDLSEQSLEALAIGLGRLHSVDILYQPCDLTDSASREILWQAIEQAGLRFHLLLNVAGVDFEGPFRERAINELRTVLQLNIEATVEMTRRVLMFRDATRTLRIVNVSSLAGYYPMPLKAIYAASKRFLLDFSLALNQELRSADITVMALCPAGMPTNQETRRGIKAQGFLGQVTTLNVGSVAVRTIELALAGRKVYIPGAFNQVMQALGSLAPPATVAFLISKRWKAARQKSIPMPAER